MIDAYTIHMHVIDTRAQTYTLCLCVGWIGADAISLGQIGTNFQVLVNPWNGCKSNTRLMCVLLYFKIQ